MIAGGEFLRYFEDLHKRARRIYPDAADFGTVIDNKELPIAREAITNLMEIYKFETDKWGDHVAKDGNWGSATEFFIPIEQNENDQDSWDGLSNIVHFNYEAARKLNIVSLEQYRVARKKKGKWGFRSD